MLHILGSYWGFLLMSLHLGLHWGMVSGAVKRKFPSVGKSMMRGAAVLAAAYGTFAFWKNRLPDYLFLRSHFVFFDFEQPLALFFLDYLAIMGLFVCCGYYGGKFLKRGRESL